MYDPYHDDMLYSPLCKREFNDIQYEDVAAETNRLLIRSPELEGVDSSYSSSFKRFKQDEYSIPFLSTNPTSPLANMDLETIFNMDTFQQLSIEKQSELLKLLPPPDIISDISNPSSCSSSTSLPLDETSSSSVHSHNHNNHTSSLHPSFFSRDENPVFWSGFHDWQSMLASGELAKQKDPSMQQQYQQQHQQQQTISTSPFKDDAFELYWGEISDREKLHNVAGDSKSITLKDMCRKGLIRVNDIIVYKRNFSACKVIVSKSMKVVKADGTLGLSIIMDGQLFEDFETPTALETKILDHHGKVARDKRPNGNAFKSIRLFRNEKDMGRLFDIRKDSFGS